MYWRNICLESLPTATAWFDSVRGSEVDSKMTVCTVDIADFYYRRIHGNILSQKNVFCLIDLGFFSHKNAAC